MTFWNTLLLYPVANNIRKYGKRRKRRILRSKKFGIKTMRPRFLPVLSLKIILANSLKHSQRDNALRASCCFLSQPFERKRILRINIALRTDHSWSLASCSLLVCAIYLGRSWNNTSSCRDAIHSFICIRTMKFPNKN